MDDDLLASTNQAQATLQEFPPDHISITTMTQLFSSMHFGRVDTADDIRPLKRP